MNDKRIPRDGPYNDNQVSYCDQQEFQPEFTKDAPGNIQWSHEFMDGKHGVQTATSNTHPGQVKKFFHPQGDDLDRIRERNQLEDTVLRERHLKEHQKSPKAVEAQKKLTSRDFETALKTMYHNRPSGPKQDSVDLPNIDISPEKITTDQANLQLLLKKMEIRTREGTPIRSSLAFGVAFRTVASRAKDPETEFHSILGEIP